MSADTRAQALSLLSQQQTPGTFQPWEMFLLYSLPYVCCSTTARCVKPKPQKGEGCFPEGCWGDTFPSSGTHGCPAHSSPLAPWEITTSSTQQSCWRAAEVSPRCISTAQLWLCLSGRGSISKMHHPTHRRVWVPDSRGGSSLDPTPRWALPNPRVPCRL